MQQDVDTGNTVNNNATVAIGNGAFHFETLSLGQFILIMNYYESYVDFMCYLLSENISYYESKNADTNDRLWMIDGNITIVKEAGQKKRLLHRYYSFSFS